MILAELQPDGAWLITTAQWPLGRLVTWKINSRTGRWEQYQ